MNSSEGLPLAQRRRAVVRAGHRGDAQVAVAALDDPAPEVRAAALGALARSSRLNDEMLQRGLTDPDPMVRNRALRLAAARGSYTPTLLDLLADPDDRVVEVAAFAIGECHDVPAEAVRALADLVHTHHDSLCRESAVAALGSLGEPEGLAAILHACRDKATVRRRAVLALAAFEGPEVTGMLETMSGDRDLQVRQSARELLDIESGEDV